MTMEANGNQMPIIISDKNELRRCVMHLWRNYNGLGLNLKNSKTEGRTPHVIRDVDSDSPAQYGGVLNNDFIIKIGNKVVEHEKFDLVLKLIKEQLKKYKKADLLLLNAAYYAEFKSKNEIAGKKIDYNSPKIVAQIKHYESPLFNPNSTTNSLINVNNFGNASNNYQTLSQQSTANFNTVNEAAIPEPRLCHLLTWPNYDGYGFFVAYNNEGCYVKNVEPNSPAQLGGLRAYDRIIEINGRSVDSKDKEFIMRQINKHKKAQIYGTTNKLNATLKSQSAYSVATTKSNKSNKSGGYSNAKYLNILVADPYTFKWLLQKKIDTSTRNRSLRVQECFTPIEAPIASNNSLADQSSPKIQPSKSSQSHHQLSDLNEDLTGSKTTIGGGAGSDQLKTIIIKMCTIRRLKGKEDQPLGFEMTKRGTQAHFISRVETGSAADLSGLVTNDYLIELNDKNIEQDENSLLREKIFNSLDTKNGGSGEFRLLTINKAGYDYCLENKIPISGFIQINNQNIQRFETPKDDFISSTNNNQNSISNQHNEQIVSSITDLTKSDQISSKYSNIPRLCILRKTKETNELGLSIARMKNVNEHIINDVVPGSLADRAGLKPNDCLLEVNGENVETKSHVETVNRIIELARHPTAEISLLVVERLAPTNNSKTSITNTPNLITKSSSSLHPSKIHHIQNNASDETLNYTTTTNSNLILNSNSNSEYLYTNVKLADSNAIAQSNKIEMPNLNAYPEVKLCEFYGYPAGTQLGLVVTSDEYSHDVVKVADDSPAHKANIAKGDVILAVNDQIVEGSARSIEQLNDFNENKPLKVLVASRYAYEWSKLLQKRITEKDWPNIKRIHTRFVPISNANTISNTSTKSFVQQPSTAATTTNQMYSQSSSKIYHEPKNIYHHENHYETTVNDIDIPTNYTTNHVKRIQTYNNNNDQQSVLLSNLCRSAVDITADGKVLRMCTLYLDPHSPNPADAEFGFDLVTKVGGGQRNGDYFIDTVDEDSPAHTSGLKTGDRLVEVDGIDVKNKTFEQVVFLINEAKIRCKLKLLVYPSVVINYGNPHISSIREQEEIALQNNNHHHHHHHHLVNTTTTSTSGYVDTRSMPDLSLESHNHNHSYNQDYSSNHNHNNYIVHNYDLSTNKSFNNKKQQISNLNDYDTIYIKKPNNLNMSKSSSNIYGTTMNSSLAYSDSSSHHNDLLRPLPRLCTLYKNDSMHLQSSNSSSNIGFGIQSKPTSTIVPNFMRVSIVNYKSAAYLSGLDAGDYIVEVNGRNTLSLSHDEALHYIKSSYEINGYVKLLVVSDFAYQWLKEHELLPTIRTDDPSIFSYADYLKNNHRYVPRLCKIKLFPFSKSFGFSIETLQIRPTSNLLTANKAASYQSFAHIVTRVEKDSAAYAASLQKGDRIIECDGINVEAESEQKIIDRINQAFVNLKQIVLFVVDPDTDNFFKSKCIKLHSFLPIVQHITNSTVV